MSVDRTVARAAGLKSTRHLELSSKVFIERHQLVWMKIVHLNVGSRTIAEEIVDEACAQLTEHWQYALAQDNVERFALNLVITELVRWQGLHGAPNVFAATAAFLRAVRESQREFEVLQESIGLYSAIAELPERQYMAIALRYVLGYSEEVSALLLGVAHTTVRSHVHQARKKLAADLHIRLN